MKKASLAFLLAIGLSSPLFAQTDSLRREIGFSTQFIFDKIFESSGAPFSLVLKKQTAMGRWVRYGLNLSISHNENHLPGINNSQEYVVDNALFTPSIGLENRKELSGRWNILYGGDLFLNLGYYSYERKYSYNNNMDRREETREEQRLGAGLRPFVGLSFNITPRLLLATEASATLSGTKSYISFYEFQEGTVIDGNDTSWNYNFSLRPASAIYVYYKF